MIPTVQQHSAKHMQLNTWLGSGLAALASVVALAAAGDARLIDAIKSNNVETVRALLTQKVDVNAALADGSTALHWAVHRDDLATVDLLIRAGARVKVANDLGATPLHLACENRNGPMVERLLQAGGDPHAALERGATVLMECARSGELAPVKALLAHGANVNAKEPLHDQTALMWAAAQQHPQVVEALIQAGADIKARSRAYSQTVVGESTQRAGREELNYVTWRGGSSPLLFAARSGDVTSVKLLLAAGADVNDALPDGTSALIVAAHSGHGKVASLLLDKGADPNNADIGYAALHAAVLRSDLDLVNTLLAHGANPDVRLTKGTPIRRETTDYNLPRTLIGATPYWLAAKLLEPDIMKVLAAAGADTKAQLPDATTALMAAAGVGATAGGGGGAGQGSDRRGVNLIDGGRFEPEARVLETVIAVISQAADVNATNESGETALHGAASQLLPAVVQLLADKGAQLNAKNKKGQTPLAMLSKDSNPTTAPNVIAAKKATVEMLRKLGATD
jgi:ankyrin repeat protein